MRRASTFARAGLLLALVAGTARCTGDDERLGCDSATVLSVRVENARGEPVEDAVVTVVRSSGGPAVTETTNGAGIARFTQSLAPDAVLVSAQAGDLVSETAQVTWVCGECGCVPTPPNVTLEVRD